jgi:hypothetical protein
MSQQPRDPRQQPFVDDCFGLDSEGEIWRIVKIDTFIRATLYMNKGQPLPPEIETTMTVSRTYWPTFSKNMKFWP